MKFNNVFGYYIEITRTHLASVPADYRRKQTVANAERFVTAELGEFEQTVLSADERRIALELEIFTALRARVAAASERLLMLAGRVAGADTLAALAEVAHRDGYCRPEVDDGGVIDLCRRAPPGGRAAGRRRELRPQRRAPRSRRPSRSCSSAAPTWPANRR